MAGSFSIAVPAGGYCGRILHSGFPAHAVATVHEEPGGTLYVGPVVFEGAPAPLTGEPMRFASWPELRASLGIDAAPAAQAA